MSNTPQGGAIDGNAADDTLMVDQAGRGSVDTPLIIRIFRPVFNPGRMLFLLVKA
ncbi:hypothetical protein ACFL9T_02500 [Thermodesulfobacteriota bacterium]